MLTEGSRVPLCVLPVSDGERRMVSHNHPVLVVLPVSLGEVSSPVEEADGVSRGMVTLPEFSVIDGVSTVGSSLTTGGSGSSTGVTTSGVRVTSSAQICIGTSVVLRKLTKMSSEMRTRRKEGFIKGLLGIPLYPLTFVE